MFLASDPAEDIDCAFQHLFQRLLCRFGLILSSLRSVYCRGEACRKLRDAALRAGAEAGELARARGRDEVVHEAADLLYFLGVALRRAEVPLAAVEEALDRRALAVRRRGGERKPSRRAEELRS